MLRKAHSLFNPKHHIVFFSIIAIFFVFVFNLPFFILKENAVITYHDQLDGELINYLLNAKYLFCGLNTYPELMNGINHAGVTTPAPFLILLYRCFSPFRAFLFSKLFVQITSMIFMYLLIWELTESYVSATLCAILFGIMPFYAVYGLCIPGLPLLLYANIKLYKKSNNIIMYAYIIIYGLCSSLALIGYATIIANLFILLVLFIKKKANIRLIVSFFCLCLSYALSNLSLLLQVIRPSEFTSHKSEIIRPAMPFWQSVTDSLINGVSYTQCYQLFFLPIILIAGVVVLINAMHNFTYVNRNDALLFVSSISGAIICAFFYAFFNSYTFIHFSNQSLGLLREFNFGRFSWLIPIFWFMALGCSINIILKYTIEKNYSAPFKFIIYSVCIICSLLTFLRGTYSNDIKPNIMKLIKPDYYMMTWKQFYAEDLFDEVDKLIDKPKKDYRVVSYGIYPAAATYNGFYCLDAYSNNYDITYKHEFRKVIEPALDKSDYLKQWFDDWGNRCYIVQPDTGTYFTFEKRWIPYTDHLDLNLDQLRTMGCHYLISAAYVINPEISGLTLLNPNDTPIQTDTSWYRLWVYTF